MRESLEAAEEAAATAAQLGDRRGRGRALNALAAARWSVDRLPEARASAADAVVVLEDAGDGVELARACAAVIRIEAVAFDPAAAIAAAPQALALASECGAEEVRVDVLVSLGLAHGHRGDPSAQDFFSEALAAGVAHGLHFQTIRAYVNAAGVAADARDHARLDALAPLARALFEDYQSIPAQHELAVMLAWSLRDRGRYAEALG